MVQAPSVQFTLDIEQAAIRKLEADIRERFIKVMDKNKSMIESMGEKGAKNIVKAIASGKSVGGTNIIARQSIKNSLLGRYVLSDKGAGELGITNPAAALDVLVDSIPSAVDVRVRVFRGKITISARLRPQRLLRMNPHPAKKSASGQNIDIESWLQWTVGPKLARGTAGFGLARVGDIFTHLTRENKIDNKRISSIIRSSRSLIPAGKQAGLMLSLKSRGGKKSPYEALTGDRGRSWSPIPFGNNFWSDWWRSNSDAMKKGFNNIVNEIMNNLSKELK